MEDVKAQLALLTRVVTDLQKVVLELKAEISALRSQSSLPKAVEPLKAVETPPATATSGPEIPDEPWTDAEAKTQAPCGSTGKQLVKTPKIVAETDLTSREKVELFAGLFAGRSDVYATRWASRTDAQKSGYSPKCTMRYTEGCSLKCHLCPHRAYEKVTAGTYYSHLKGDIVMGVYPLLTDNTCRFAVLDFDDSDWERDGKAVIKTARKHGIPLVPEISRSACGVHLWLFLSVPMQAAVVRRVLERLIALTIADEGLLKLDSFDRIIPCQDELPRGNSSIGNLVALPMQPEAKARGGSVFVDDDLNIIERPWRHLKQIRRMTPDEAESFLRNTGRASPLTADGTAGAELLLETLPWERVTLTKPLLAAPNVRELSIRLDNAIYFKASELTAPLSNALVRLATFANPAFYKQQLYAKPVWKNGSMSNGKDLHRFITYAKAYPDWLSLPRGTLAEVRRFLDESGISFRLEDARSSGAPVSIKFQGTLTPEQATLLKAVMKTEQGIVVASTGFGKTVFALALIASRSVSTVVIVHRKELLRQWRARIATFLDIPENGVGEWVGTKKRLTGTVDIVMEGTLAGKPESELRSFFAQYGQVIVDECHHAASSGYAKVLGQCASRYLVGLTATFERTDGTQKATSFLCGPIIRKLKQPNDLPVRLDVRRFQHPESFSAGLVHAELMNRLACHAERNQFIFRICNELVRRRRRVLVLTNRQQHVEELSGMFKELPVSTFVLTSEMSAGDRASVVRQIDELPASQPRIIVATGQLIGEGFDHAPLDTLLLAMPLASAPVLTQYIGRIVRLHETKTDAEIIDIVDSGVTMLERQYVKRQKTYRSRKVSFDRPNASGSLWEEAFP